MHFDTDDDVSGYDIQIATIAREYIPTFDYKCHAKQNIKKEIRTRKLKFINIIYKSKWKESIKLIWSLNISFWNILAKGVPNKLHK